MSWNEAELLAVLDDMRQDGDDFTLIEVKPAFHGLPENLPQSTCAFADMPAGGTVILGVDENAGFDVCGVPDANEMVQGLISQTRELVAPAPHMEVQVLQVDNKNVIIVEVMPLAPTLKPALCRGLPYLRQSDGDYVMNDNDLHMMRIAGLHHSEQTDYDVQPVTGTSINDLDPHLVARYLKEARTTSRTLQRIDSDDDLLRMTGVLNDDGELTYAGLYGLGFFPQGRLPALSVTAAVQLPRDGSGARTRNLVHFDGPLPVLLRETLQWIQSNINTDLVYRADGHMVKRPEFPMRAAIREILANALVHRDLGPDTVGAGKRVEIRLTGSALIVVNPGGLRGVSIQQLQSADLSKAAVNQRLYEMMKRLTTEDGASIIEGEGGGIQEIFASTRDADLHRPKLIDAGVQFKVFLRRGSVFSESDDRTLKTLAPGKTLSHIQKALLLSLDAGGQWTRNRMLREFSPLGREEAEQQLQELEVADLIRTVGNVIHFTHGDTGTPAVGENEGWNEADLRKISKNAPRIVGALKDGGESSFKDIMGRTELSQGQARYALSALIDAGLVDMLGQRGDRATRYRIHTE